MNIITGDIIALAEQGMFDVIIHGCNCFHTMGAGIARTISDKYPEALKADKKSKYGDATKLGTYTSVFVPNFTIVNAYTQYSFGSNGPNVDYNAIHKVFSLIQRDFTGMRIGYPAIGAGLAGGDWGRIYSIICKVLGEENHTFVKYSI